MTQNLVRFAVSSFADIFGRFGHPLQIYLAGTSLQHESATVTWLESERTISGIPSEAVVKLLYVILDVLAQCLLGHGQSGWLDVQAGLDPIPRLLRGR